MKLITKLVLAGTTLLSVSLPALANTPDWRYVEGGFTRYGFDNSNFEPDGLHVAGKYLLDGNFYANGEFGWLDESGFDFTTLTLGGGYRLSVNNTTDAYVGANFERIDADNYDDNGYSLVTGVRSMVLPELELNGELGYYDVDEGDITLKVGANYYFNPQFAVGASYKFIDDADVLQVSARYAF